MSDTPKCPRCNGRGWVEDVLSLPGKDGETTPKLVHVTCQPCHGSGVCDQGEGPCRKAIDDLWREIILKRRPDYGDWEYPAQAFRHILEEVNALQADHDVLAAREGAREARLISLEAEVELHREAMADARDAEWDNGYGEGYDEGLADGRNEIRA